LRCRDPERVAHKQTHNIINPINIANQIARHAVLRLSIVIKVFSASYTAPAFAQT
jgi:hypothetical protein